MDTPTTEAPTSSETVTTDQLVRVFIKLRNARSAATAEYKRKDADLKEKQVRVEMELLRRATEQGVEGFRTAEGTTYKGEEMQVSIADDDTWYAFLQGVDDPFAFYERRILVNQIKAYQADHEGAIPPGLRVFRENRMRVRAG